MSHSVSLCVQNVTGRLWTVRLEPWARHFLLLPKEKIGVIVHALSRTPGLRLVESSNATLIYTEGSDRVCVVQGGITHDLLPVYGAPPPTAGLWRSDDPMWDRDLDSLA